MTEKGEKRRPIFFGDATADALRRWLARRPADPTAWVFVSLGPRKPGGKLRASELTHILTRRAEKAGVEGRVNAHRFRHGFARGYLQRGGDLASLARLMGHSDSVVTSSYYAVFAESELATMHARYSPAALVEAMAGG